MGNLYTVGSIKHSYIPATAFIHAPHRGLLDFLSASETYILNTFHKLPHQQNYICNYQRYSETNSELLPSILHIGYPLNHISCDDTEQEYNKQHRCIITHSHYQHPFTGILIVVAIAVATATDITANGAKNNAPASARTQLISLKNIHLFHLSAKIFTFLNGSHT